MRHRKALLSCIECGVTPEPKIQSNGRLRYGIVRGLCVTCYNKVTWRIEKGESSWEESVSAGRALDHTCKGFARASKECPDCEETFPIEDYRVSNRAYPAPYCKECRKKRALSHNDRHFFKTRANQWRNGSGRSDVPIEARDLAGLWKTQRGKCCLSGRKLTKENAELDHIVARSKGGADTIGNLRWLCADANRAKNTLSDQEFVALCRDIISVTDSR